MDCLPCNGSRPTAARPGARKEKEMRAFRALRWVALGMAIGGLTFGAVTARAANKLDNQPFSGVLTGTSTGTPSSVTIVGSVSSGSINATHLGNGTYTLTVTEDYERMQDEEHPTGNCGFVEDGKNTPATAGLVITAANGDQLFGALDDDRSVICAPDTQT